jgi:hypothetical protein
MTMVNPRNRAPKLRTTTWLEATTIPKNPLELKQEKLYQILLKMKKIKFLMRIQLPEKSLQTLKKISKMKANKYWI